MKKTYYSGRRKWQTNRRTPILCSLWTTIWLWRSSNW